MHSAFKNFANYFSRPFICKFVFMTIFLQILAMDHFMQIIFPKFVFVRIVIPDNHFWQIVVVDSVLANCCSKQFSFCKLQCESFFAGFANSFSSFLFLQIFVADNLFANFGSCRSG